MTHFDCSIVLEWGWKMFDTRNFQDPNSEFETPGYHKISDYLGDRTRKWVGFDCRILLQEDCSLIFS
jgi:hypothetical protein